MKATLTFDLPEERSEYEIYSAAMTMYCAINDFENYFRDSVHKSECEESLPDFFNIRDKFYEIFEEAHNKLSEAC